MMKRPRSFIATTLALLCLTLLPAAGLVIPATVAHAAPTTRLMNPRAGDPDEPGSGIAPPGSGGIAYQPQDPLWVVPVPVGARVQSLRAPSNTWQLAFAEFISLFFMERR
jgi:hypothetical protein